MVEFTEENFIQSLIPLLDKIGFTVEGKAKELCPVDTGRLRASIQHKNIPLELSVIIGTNVEYAKYVEFMHPLDSPKPGRECGQMPFLRPSLFLSKNKIKQLIREHFKGR
jgi:phage gpG-like protein